MQVSVLESAPELKAQVRKEVNSAVVEDVALADLNALLLWAQLTALFHSWPEALRDLGCPSRFDGSKCFQNLFFLATDGMPLHVSHWNASAKMLHGMPHRSGTTI